MSESREIEAKFDIDADDRQQLLSLSSVGRFVVEERHDVVQDDIYFDTEEAHLASAGATLRLRRSAGRTRMTFKGRREVAASDDEAHIASRLEDEVLLSPEQARRMMLDGPLPAMTDLSPLVRARSFTGDHDLKPIARLSNNRTTLLIRDPDGASLELAVDECVGTRFRDGRMVSFDEVEIETKSADRAALDEVSQELRALVPGLHPSRLTKLGRTLD